MASNNKNNPVKLDKDTVKAIADIVIDRLREEETSSVKERYDKRRANVKMLLKTYNALIKHYQNAVYDIEHTESEDSIETILELMSGNRFEHFRIESIKQSTVRTRLIVEHVNTMIELYRIYCENSTKDEDLRRYRVIYYMYLEDKPMTATELAEQEGVELRTIYRDVDAAVERLTALIFGIDGLYFLKK